MMCFRGGGVGHKSTREATDFFKQDRDRLDVQSTATSDLEIDGEAAENENNSEGDDSGIDEDVEDDYGYVKEQSDNSDEEPEEEELADDEYFGPEDDGGGVDPDMAELGYADL